MKVLWVVINYNPLLFSLKRKGGQQDRQVAQWEEVIRHAECAEKGGKHVRALSGGATIVYSRQKARQMQSWSEDLELPFLGEQATRVPGSPRPSRKGKRISPDSLTSLSTDSWLVGKMRLSAEIQWDSLRDSCWDSITLLAGGKISYSTETPISYWLEKRNFIKHNWVLKLVTKRRTYKVEITIAGTNRRKDWPTIQLDMNHANFLLEPKFCSTLMYSWPLYCTGIAISCISGWSQKLCKLHLCLILNIYMFAGNWVFLFVE